MNKSSIANIPAAILTLAILAAVVFWFSDGLRQGTYMHSDEFLTLERSYGFLKFDDWLTVYSNNEVSHKKPPLQYWLSAVLLRNGADGFFSVRVWSFLFLAGTCLGTALLTRQLAPDNPWAPAASVLLLIASSEFVQNGRSGLLDSGMAFFVLMTILSFFKARDDGRWWLVCGLCAGLGALQKTPLALGVVLLFLAVCRFCANGGCEGYSWSELKRDRRFLAGLCVAVVLTLAWPALQVVAHGTGHLKVAYGQEMLERFTPGISTRQEFWSWAQWFWEDWAAISVLSAACVGAAVFSRRWRDDHRAFLLAVFVLLFWLFMSAASGRVFYRYFTTLLPILACLTACVIGGLRFKPLVLVMAAALFLASFGRVERAVARIHDDNTTSVRRVCEAFQGSMASARFLVLDRRSIPPGAFGYYVDTKMPVRVVDYIAGVNAKNLKSKLKFPAMGIELYEFEPNLREIVSDYKVIWSDGRVFIWRVEG
jgi:4-amino-4-deoxy-L-arabinose transferase-like glycosyltransferase